VKDCRDHLGGNVETRGVFASVHVGESPGDILLTPDGEYALVMDQRSGNVSVVNLKRIADALQASIAELLVEQNAEALEFARPMSRQLMQQGVGL